MNATDDSGTEPRPRDFTARLDRRARGIGARPRPGRWQRRALALVAALAVPAFAAPGGWQNFTVEPAGTAEAEVQPMPFERAGDSFPGSAFYYLAPEDAAPLAPDAHAEGGALRFASPAARALFAAGSGSDRERALTCLTQAVYYEAASEPDAGQRAVAQVVLNRVAHPAYPDTVCGVVYQGSERSTGCQFTFTCDGSMARVPVPMFWRRAEAVARAALAGAVYAPVGLATHYHTIAVHPGWSDRLAYLMTIGAHRFYAMHGRAGAAATFNAAAYAGSEPAARPRPKLAGAGADPALDPVAVEQAFASPSTPREAVPLPEAWGIRPEYRDSGRWIAQPGS